MVLTKNACICCCTCHRQIPQYQEYLVQPSAPAPLSLDPGRELPEPALGAGDETVSAHGTVRKSITSSTLPSSDASKSA
jgi:hypothetical protein